MTGNPRVGVMVASAGGGGGGGGGEGESAQSWLLSVSDVRRSDAGVYMCQVNTSPRMRQDFRLRVVGE